MKKYNIILVDDSEDYTILLEHCFLESADAEIISFTNPKLALNYIQENNESLSSDTLLLTDILMPDLSGLELSEAVKAFNNKIKICFLSNCKDETVISNAFKIGACEYILKDRTKDEIINKINKIIDNDLKETPEHIEVYEVSDVLSTYEFISSNENEITLKTKEEVSLHSIIRFKDDKNDKLYRVEKCELHDDYPHITCRAV